MNPIPVAAPNYPCVARARRFPDLASRVPKAYHDRMDSAERKCRELVDVEPGSPEFSEAGAADDELVAACKAFEDACGAELKKRRREEWERSHAEQLTEAHRRQHETAKQEYAKRGHAEDFDQALNRQRKIDQREYAELLAVAHRQAIVRRAPKSPTRALHAVRSPRSPNRRATAEGNRAGPSSSDSDSSDPPAPPNLRAA